MDIKKLCQSGAFSQFVALMGTIELPDVTFDETNKVMYQLGKRDGAEEFRSAVIEEIESLAKAD